MAVVIGDIKSWVQATSILENLKKGMKSDKSWVFNEQLKNHIHISPTSVLNSIPAFVKPLVLKSISADSQHQLTFIYRFKTGK